MERPAYVRPLHTAPHPCPTCAGPITIRGAPGAAARRKYCSVPCRAKSSRKAEARVCRGCKQLLPFDAYNRFDCGSVKWRCKGCEKPKRAMVRRGPLMAPSPCLGCGKEFFVDAPASRVKTRKVCSRACHIATLTMDSIDCNRCLRTLPLEAFDYQPCGNRRRRSCRECWAKMYAKVAGTPFFRPPPSELLRIARARATAKRLPFTLSRKDARHLYAAPCVLCAGPCGHLRLEVESAGYVPGNVRPVCRPCHKLLKTIPLREIVKQSLKIAQQHTRGQGTASHAETAAQGPAPSPRGKVITASVSL